MRFFAVMLWKYPETRSEKWGKMLFLCITGTAHFSPNFASKKNVSYTQDFTVVAFKDL